MQIKFFHMQIIETPLQGLIELRPKIFKDERGYFFESFNEKVFEEIIPGAKFVQDNQSFSIKGVVRGLHLQKNPFAQGKLVRVIKGKVLDVAVDLRSSSKTFGQHYKVILDDQMNNLLYVPEGFAHGFSALEETIFSYKCTNFYNKESELGIIWNDKTLNIDWQVENPIVSSKDVLLEVFDPTKTYFE